MLKCIKDRYNKTVGKTQQHHQALFLKGQEMCKIWKAENSTAIA